MKSGIGSGKKAEKSTEIKAFLMPCDEIIKIMNAKCSASDSEKGNSVVPVVQCNRNGMYRP